MKTTINGHSIEFEPRHDETALEVIRERAGLTGTKLACGGGICGACTVRVAGVALCSCLMPATQMDGKEIETIEQHGRDNLHPVQRAFMANEGLQCGFCTPGFINEGIAFYDRWRAEYGTKTPSREQVALAMSGHLCRCAAYIGIYDAIQQACAGQFDDMTDLIAPRVDALEKVTGEATYTVDAVLGTQQLEGKILRSIHPHAIIRSVDKRAALALDGVLAVTDLLAGKERVRWVGQPIVGVAAVDEQSAEKALSLIKVDYDIQPAVIDFRAAMDKNSAEVYPDGKSDMPTAAEGMSLPYRWENNVGHIPFSLITSKRPNKAARKIDAARQSNSKNLSEYTFHNAQQVHTALEPHATIAQWTGTTALHVIASTQNVHALRTKIADHFDLDREQVTVESHYIGGGFGGKQGLYEETIAAVTLARATQGRAVRVVASRFEDLAYTGLRPGSLSETSILTNDDGSPQAIRLHAYGDAGIASGTIAATGYSTMSPSGILRDLRDYAVLTNTTAGKPFRGPDAPVARWAIEQAIDEAAVKHQLDPVAMRRKWWPDHAIKNRLLDWVESLPAWQTRGAVGSDEGRYKRGIGLAATQWFFLYNPDVEVKVSVSPAGITVHCATQDIGNGTRTALAKAVEDAMGIDRNTVRLDIGNADRPLGPTAGGSQVTTSVYPTTFTATARVMAHLVEEAEAKLGLKEPIAGQGGITHQGGFTPWDAVWAIAEPFSFTEKRGKEQGMTAALMNLAMGENDPSIGRRFGHGMVVTEVEVDTRLGKIRPINVWTAVAVGRIFVPELATSQLYSGVIQGLGYALYEAKQYDFKTGHTLTGNLNDYRLPGIGDTPDIHVHYDEEGHEKIRGQGFGLAELATIGVAASVGNAVYHATGWRPTNTPITPQDVVSGLQGV